MTTGFTALRDLASRAGPPKSERCELCGTRLTRRHRHLINLDLRRLLCACEACTALFPASANRSMKAVPNSVRSLDRFQLTEEQWDSLLIPIGLAFFVRSGVDSSVVAFYPSPAGPAESHILFDAWRAIIEDNPELAGMQPDVEALLVNRLEDPRGYYLAPIDRCYELAGLVRRNWRGLSGGAEMWEQTRCFFRQLKEAAHA